MTELEDVISHELVGPVLIASETGIAIAAAIHQCNKDVTVVNQGAYLRIGAPGCCRLTCDAAESELGRPFLLPADLECVMPAFKGTLEFVHDGVEWRAA